MSSLADSTSLRAAADGPWCWQSKAARRRIREGCDGGGTVATALAVYDALTEIASDKQSETFTTTVGHIAMKCGVKDRYVRQRLAELSELGIIAVETPALKAPSTYRLLAVHGIARQDEPSDRHQMPNVRQATPIVRHFVPHDRHSAKIQPMPPLEEKEKNRLKNPIAASAAAGGKLDVCFNTLCRIEGADPSQLTKSQGRKIGVALAEIRRADPNVTPEELNRRATRYRSKFSGAALTAHAVAKHWASLGGGESAPKVAARDTASEPSGWREIANEDPTNPYACGGDKEGTSWAAMEPAHQRFFIDKCRERDAARRSVGSAA